MFKHHTRRAPGAIAGLCAFASLGIFASPAMAASVGQVVSGTTQPSLSLTAGAPAVFTTGFMPGQTASASSVLTATDTNPSWTLQVQDAGTGQGKMVAATGATCTGSDATLANPLAVMVNDPLLTGVVSSGQVSLSGSNQNVATATNQLLASAAFTTSYSQTIPASEVMATGCLYSLTATYTLQ
jgi:hypothetical protein